ncbi:MAG: outer membrane protein transport protein [Planctomycetes bacterium]|nr:outer membrane protein transport protein [Planctomycetota bacterium]
MNRRIRQQLIRSALGGTMVALAIVAAFQSPASASNGVELNGVSLQARSRGGADVAVGDSALSQIDNPAALSLAPRRRDFIAFTNQTVFPTVDWRGPLDSSRSDRRIIPLADFGYANSDDDRWSWGVAFHSRCGLATQYNYRPLLMPWREVRAGTDAKNVNFSFNAAYKVTDQFSIGAGIRAEVVTAEFRKPLAIADIKFGRGYAYGIGFDLGAHYRPTDKLSFGIAYRSPTWATDLAGGAATASIMGLPSIRLGDANIDQIRLPQRVSIGAAYDLTSWCKLVAEAPWITYRNSTWRNLVVATDVPLDWRVQMPLGYADQYVFIIGADLKLDENWTLGVGYNHGTNPIRRTHLNPVGSVLNRDDISVGIRYSRENWWVGAGYIIGLPQRMSGSGWSKIPLGIDYAHSEIRQMQQSLIAGFGISW